MEPERWDRVMVLTRCMGGMGEFTPQFATAIASHRRGKLRDMWHCDPTTLEISGDSSMKTTPLINTTVNLKR